MTELKLRKEFLGRRLKGTTIDFENRSKTGALQKSAAEFLEITYPTRDLLKLLEATGPKQARPVVLIGTRGQGKSHLMAALYHMLNEPDEAQIWLEDWRKRLSEESIVESLAFRSDVLLIAESLHLQRYKYLWDILFEKHPKGAYIKGKWEALGEKKPDIPSYDLLVEMFQEKPIILMLDEFQTWYDGLTNTKQYPWRNWAFNFIQILSEISQNHPDLLVLVVSVRNNDSEAYQQIHRVNPALVDFKGPYAKRDRQRLLLHRLFENRHQIPQNYIETLLAAHIQEFLRLQNISGADHDCHRIEFYEAWPYAPHLLQLLEDQVLIATSAQETRDMIRILADLFKRNDKTPVITAADFRLDDEKSGVAALLDSVANEYHRKLREKAQRNLEAVHNAAKNIGNLPHASLIISSLWLRSLAVDSKTAGADAATLQVDITRDKAIDDNFFADELTAIIENSFNIHPVGNRYIFKEEENAEGKLKAFAKNDRLFTEGEDVEQLRKEIRYTIGGGQDMANRYRVIVLGKKWSQDPWNEIEENERPQQWDNRIPLVAVPESPENIQVLMGRWLKKHVAQKRNIIRFILPQAGTSNIFYNRDFILLARMVVMAHQWKKEDKEYTALHKKYEKELQKKLASLFDRFAVLNTWNFSEPEKCQFHLLPHRTQGIKIPTALEEIISRDLFIPEDFEELVKLFADKQESVGKFLEELQEPRPNGLPCIPWLGEVHSKEKLLKMCAGGLIAIDNRGMEMLQAKSGEMEDEVWKRIRGKLSTGQHLFQTYLRKPQPVTTTDGVAYGSKPADTAGEVREKPTTAGVPKDGAEIFKEPAGAKKTVNILTADATSALNLQGKMENWNIGPATRIQNVSLTIDQATGDQLLALIRKLPDGIIYGLKLEKEQE